MTVDDGAIEVIVEWPGWATAGPSLEPRLAAIARAAVEAACPGLGPVGIAILLADDDRLRALNRDWRHRDAPTNVLSFPATDTREGERPPPPPAGAPLELGDVALAFETCRREAEASGRPLIDHAAHLVAHGTLHLLGYDHEADEPAARMERLEAAILAGFGIADPYEDALEVLAGDG